MIIGDMLRRNAARFRDKDALVYQGHRTSFGALNKAANQVANSLRSVGVAKHDRVAVLLHNCREFVEIYFGSAKIGTVFVPINTLLTTKELDDILRYISPRVLFVAPDLEERVQAATQGASMIERLIGLEGCSASLDSYAEFLKEGDPVEPESFVEENDVMTMNLTSGTTGRPKGALRTHRHNYLNALVETIETGLVNDDRALFVSPPYHIIFDSVFLRHYMLANTIVVVREGGFDPQKVLHLLAKERISMVQLVPTTLNALLQEEGLERYDLSSLRLILYASAPMPTALLKKAIKRFNCGFMQLYGQTESGPTVSALRPEEHVLDGSDMETRLASAGRGVINYEIRIVDKEDKDTKVGEVGEIVVKGDAMMKGYWGLPEETTAALRGGWLHTGDMGRLDEKGYLYIVDRKNDMMISGGKNIYPREIEEVLYQHHAVLEVVVVGVPDEYWGEAVKAIVVLKDGMNVTEGELIEFCKMNLASYKKPRSVEFRSVLPKSPTGKVLKRKIREEYWKGLERKV